MCAECHSTNVVKNYDIESDSYNTTWFEINVGCESCHGPGSAYKSAGIMKNQKLSLAKGLIIPDESVCVKCHNDESPTFKGFNYDEYVAKIAHDDPTTN